MEDKEIEIEFEETRTLDEWVNLVCAHIGEPVYDIVSKLNNYLENI